YQSDLARMILGDTLHPGGLALTNHLGRLMGLQRDDWVVDLASGRGSSALAVSRVFHCQVLGVEFGRASAIEAREASLASPASPRAYFVQGDAESPPLQSARFDAVFSECSLSLFPNKLAALREAARLLRPGGFLGLSDVTVEPGSLPPELDNSLGQMLCLCDALSVTGYQELIGEAGLHLTHSEDASGEVLKLLEELAGKLGAFLAWQELTGKGAESNQLRQAPELIDRVRDLVESGRLGYWLFAAQKPISENA
ncbi:MAG: class I SAM-dependent methyltransferase, partial [Dehalococcoidia bacterium]